ncbi:MAG TPA: flagellar hook-length control protein FliK, partial [Candidatus Hydrogenedentes bacterium]|nr:flagellar hook-length control protein FliK [Candidatus Hydrogenedentota bacterium]
METSPVLLSLIPTGQGIEGGLDAGWQEGSGVSGESASFALVLAQHAASNIAATLGDPALALPSEDLQLESGQPRAPSGAGLLESTQPRSPSDTARSECDQPGPPTGAVLVECAPPQTLSEVAAVPPLLSQANYVLRDVEATESGETEAAAKEEDHDAGALLVPPFPEQVPGQDGAVTRLSDGHSVESDPTESPVTLRSTATYGESPSAAWGRAGGQEGQAVDARTLRGEAKSPFVLRLAPPKGFDPPVYDTGGGPPVLSAPATVVFGLQPAREAFVEAAPELPSAGTAAPRTPPVEQEQIARLPEQPSDLEPGFPDPKNAMESRPRVLEESLVQLSTSETVESDISDAPPVQDAPSSAEPASANHSSAGAGPVAIPAGASQAAGPTPAGVEVVEFHASPEPALRDSLAELAVKSVRYLVSEDKRSLRIRLVPESLGEVRIELVSTRNELHLKLVSGSASVREAMESASDALRHALTKDGVHLVRVSVAGDGAVSSG